jgi:hypothetical protein
VYWGSVRGTWREGSFTGDPEGYVKKDSGNKCLMGNHGGNAALPGLKGEILIYQQSLFIGGAERYVKKRFWKWATLSIVALLGNLEEGSLTVDFDRQ